MKNFDINKIELLNQNTLIRDIYSSTCHIFIENILLISRNENIIVANHQNKSEILDKLRLYDELIIVQSPKSNFSSLYEFVYVSLLKSYVEINILDKIFEEIMSEKEALNKNEFMEILNWGFFDNIHYDYFDKIQLVFNEFHSAHTLYQYPEQPLFVAALDDKYFLFISNTYT
ncbi:MAG: hypothetical protein U5M51_00935 [Emticicia sp.]|nr:hypothetical protein [Emticicia sp.]